MSKVKFWLGVGLVGLSLTASAPSYSYAGCKDGLTEHCETHCQRKERIFGSYIHVCTFEVTSCSMVACSG